MEIYRNKNTVFIQAEGKVSFLTVNEIKRLVYDYIEPKDTEIVVNLSKVDFLDSAGLGLLISFLKLMKKRGGKVVLEHPKLGVQKLLEMTRMDELFDVKKRPEPTTGSWNEFM
ncbi:MAG: STAS domain-containing protein [Clostridiales bacterium]|nr:STAS domain-containing protein [Clostridiales bacterium]